MIDNENQLINGRYRLVKKLGEGAMGIVYKGEDTHTGQIVAVKALKPQAIVENPTRLERFIREAEALYQLEHPHIVKVYDTIKFNEMYFIVMEYMQGGSLRELLQQEKRLPINFAVETGLDLSDALIRVHRLKIVHRDVKPDNVLLNEHGVARLTDFGAAHITDAATITTNGAFIGTLHYMAPEILKGKPVDHRVDIWSFGVMMYEMVTGYKPFMGKNIKDVLLAIITQPIPGVDKLRPDCPPRLVKLIHAMLIKDRDQRISSMRQVGAELELILEGGV